MNRTLILSSNFPKEKEEYFLEKSIGATSNANNSFQWAIIDGLEENRVIIDVITAPNIGAFPVRFKDLHIPRFKFNLNNTGRGLSLSWTNLLFFKHKSIYKNLRQELKRIDLSIYENVVIYDLYPVFFDLLEFIKTKNPKLKIIAIVPDIIGMTRGKSNSLLRVFDAISLKKVENGLNYIDGIVYLTKYMHEKMPLTASNIPSIVIEGICNPDVLSLKSNQSKIENKYILYTGSLDVRHGIMNLIEAFKNVEDSSLELWICGDGDGKQLVEEECSKHPSIKYLGQKPRKEIIFLQSKAYLLINPRTSEGEFTKYSFPSKIIEYFLSGRPCFMYKLPGIPDEYFNYCFFSEKEDVRSLTESLNEISNFDSKKMERIGEEAKNFILNNKSSRIQAKKIIDLFKVI